MKLIGVDEALADSILIELARHLPDGYDTGTVRAVSKDLSATQVLTKDGARDVVFEVNTGQVERLTRVGEMQEYTAFRHGIEVERYMIRYDSDKEA